MNHDETQYRAPLDSEERQRARQERYRLRRMRVRIMRLIVALVLLLILSLIIVLTSALRSKNRSGAQSGGADKPVSVNAGTAAKEPDAQADQPAGSTDIQTADNAREQSGQDGDNAGGTAAQAEAHSEAPAAKEGSALEQAAAKAAGYDYDGAIALLEAVPDHENDTAILEALAGYQQAKASCTAVDVNTVPHIFYHSLINDTSRAFNYDTLGEFAVNGMNAWMTTVEEFDKITQKLYEAGYVYVRLRDLVVETKNEDGSSTFAPNTNLMLPPGKKAIVLSIDDLSYYHSYKAAGFPDKMVLDENGLVKCQYTTAEGETQIGDFDVVPRLNTFLREHPDGAYKGARGLIAMTGYNGVFGYRTDKDYELREHLMEDQAQWLAEHPDFNRQEEIAQATRIADAIKAEGWEFASHTWGHLSVTGVSADRLQVDNEKWVENVQNIVGPVDTIIFAHGADIGSWEGYTSDNPQYNYFKSAGYNFYCNVDGSVPYWVQITSDYVRQGRINLDGYMLYRASSGETTVLDNMFTASEVFDSRRPTPVIAQGQG